MTLTDFQSDLRSQRNVDREYDEQYGIWKKFIEAMIEDASQNAMRISYTKYREDDGVLLFNLDEPLIESNFTQETVFISERADDRPSSKKGKVTLHEIGSFLEFRSDGEILAIKKTGKRLYLTAQGHVCVDYRRDIHQYRRQEIAMDEFRRAETITSGNMKSIFVGVEQPGNFRLLQQPKYFSDLLDMTQRRAVRKILESNDFAIIQGPPGTGKTNVIVEVVRQILKENEENPASNKRVLIVSQSHTAVDKVLTDLNPHLSDATTVRIGSENDIDPVINDSYGLYHCQRNWEERSIELCAAQLKTRLEQAGIQYEDFRIFANAMECLSVKNNTESEFSLSEDALYEFESTYDKSRNDPFLKQCYAMEQWCRYLIEKAELGEFYIRDATIVAGTCLGFISNPYVRSIVFDYAIVDEAAKATLPEIMVALVRARKIVLVGDHKQLPPVFDREVLAKNENSIQISKLENTGFGKLFDLMPETSKETLSTQYRMHPCIGDLISQLFYRGEVQNGVDSEKRKLELTYFSGKAIKWISTSSTSNRFEQAHHGKDGARSYINPLEITVLQQCLSDIDAEMSKMVTPYSIGIITPYRAQAELIRKRLHHAHYKSIKIDVNTVDAFQGSQRDIVIYSTVRSSKRNVIGFLREQARLNVSFSRAMRGLIIIGDAKFLDNSRIRDNRFPEILRYIRANHDFCSIINYVGGTTK